MFVVRWEQTGMCSNTIISGEKLSDFDAEFTIINSFTRLDQVAVSLNMIKRH